VNGVILWADGATAQGGKAAPGLEATLPFFLPPPFPLTAQRTVGLQHNVKIVRDAHGTPCCWPQADACKHQHLLVRARCSGSCRACWCKLLRATGATGVTLSTHDGIMLPALQQRSMVNVWITRRRRVSLPVQGSWSMHSVCT